MFAKAKFHGEVRFYAIDFGKRSTFSEAHFLGQASFRGATFGSSQFHKTVFDGPVDFEGCTFGAPITYSGAEFKQGVSFSWSQFENWGLFTEVEVTGGFKFTYVRARFDLAFSNLQLHGGADFRDLRAVRVLFTRIALGPEMFLDLRTAQVESMVLESVSLDRWFLVPMIGPMDLTRVNVSFPKLGRREVLYEEALLEEGADVVRPELIEAEYRKLKSAAISASDNEGAGLFHYNERDVRRRRTPALSLRRFQLEVFRVACGYGERPWRSIGFNLGGLLFFTLVYVFVTGFSGGESVTYVRYLPIPDLSSARIFIHDFGRAFLHSSTNWFPLGLTGELSAVQVSGAGAWVELFERLLGVIAVAFFALSFSRQLQR